MYWMSASPLISDTSTRLERDGMVPIGMMTLKWTFARKERSERGEITY
jgi:hypothetical protein